MSSSIVNLLYFCIRIAEPKNVTLTFYIFLYMILFIHSSVLTQECTKIKLIRQNNNLFLYQNEGDHNNAVEWLAQGKRNKTFLSLAE